MKMFTNKIYLSLTKCFSSVDDEDNKLMIEFCICELDLM